VTADHHTHSAGLGGLIKIESAEPSREAVCFIPECAGPTFCRFALCSGWPPEVLQPAGRAIDSPEQVPLPMQRPGR